MDDSDRLLHHIHGRFSTVLPCVAGALCNSTMSLPESQVTRIPYYRPNLFE